MMANNSQNLKSNEDVVFEIKSRLDIVDVVSEHVVLKKSGKNYWGLCPFHQEKTPSFSVNADIGIFKCFGCGEGGDAISFMMKVNRTSFYETITELAQKFGLALPHGNFSSEKTEIRTKIYEINKKTAEYYKNLLLNEPEGKKAKEYLFARGIDREIIEKFSLGYSPKSSDSLINHLIDNFKETYDVMDSAGLISKKTNGEGYVDRFRNRIMIPILDDKGNAIAFGGRALDEGQNPKYLNSPDTPVFNKSRCLFALNHAKEAIKSEDGAVIMEGYFDVITAHVYGIQNAVATLGTALTAQHLKILSRYTESRRIFMAFDFDKAGIAATDRGAEIIKETFESLGGIRQFDENFAHLNLSDNNAACEIRIISHSSAKDADEFIRANGADAYKKLILNAPLLIDFQINRILKSKSETTTPQDKADAIKLLIPILSEIKNLVIRDEYVKLVCERLDINEESLSLELKKSLQKKKSKTSVIKPIISKKVEKHLLAQKNLLSLYFINNEKLKDLCINECLKEVNFTEPCLCFVKNLIEQLQDSKPKTEDLIEDLFAKCADNEEAKKLIADVLYSLEDKEYLEEKQLKLYIEENIHCLSQQLNVKLQKQLKESYYKENGDEENSIVLQHQVKELVQLKRAKLEIIYEER
jgi:DNA primase